MAFSLGEVAAEELFTAELASEAVAASVAAGDIAAAGGGAGFEVPAAVSAGAKAAAVSFTLARLFAPEVDLAKGGTPQAFLANTLSNLDPIPVIYGSRRVGASVIEVGLTATEIAADRLHRIAIWGEGPISAVQALYLDTVSYTDSSRFGVYPNGGVQFVEQYLGTDTQAASPTLIAFLGDPSKWNANCTLSGIAYTYLTLVWNPTMFPHGRPVITADIDGRTLYDPRDASTAFSRNPALVIRDYLTNERYGRGVPTSMIDDDAFGDAADHCDELVTVPDGAGGTTTQARYTCDGVLNVDQTPLDNLKALLTSCRGFMVFSGGQYKLKIDKAETPVAFVLSTDNIVGGWSIQLGGKRNRFNRVKARFFNQSANWQPDIAVWPPDGPTSATWAEEDANQVLEQTLDLPFTRDFYTAAQIAQIEAKRSRFGTLVSLTATIAATCLEVGDVVPLNHATPGWPAATDPVAGKLFRVIEMELLSSDEVRVTLLEYDADVYDLETPDQVTAPATTSLPDLSSVAVPGVPSVTETLYSTLGSAGVKSRATVAWGASDDAFVGRGGWYQLERSPAGVGSWTVYPQIPPPGDDGDTVTFIVDDIATGTYDWRVAAFNTIGAKSAYSATTTKEIVGLTAAPSNVANFAVQAYSGQAKFTWDKPTATLDLDVVIGGRTFVRWSPRTTAASWNDGSLVNPDGYPGDTSIGFGPLMTGTYMAKHRDSSGNYSSTEASFVVTEALITGMVTLATLTESPTFAGAKTHTVAVDSVLKLDGSTNWDSVPGNIDDWGYVDSLGGVASSGSYAFSAKMDLGSVKNCRLFSSIRSVAFDTADLWDLRTNNMDDWGLVDGDVIDDAEAVLMVRKTDDDPNTGSPTWGAWHRLGLVGDYNARGFDFRLEFTSGSPTHNRQVDQLVVTAKQ